MKRRPSQSVLTAERPATQDVALIELVKALARQQAWEDHMRELESDAARGPLRTV